jgi:hypothetical protein
MSVTHADFPIERRYGCTPALERILAGEPVR